MPSVETSGDGRVQVDGQSPLPLHQTIFDEMNLVELPFALLSLKPTSSRVFSLSQDGRERLVADEAVGGLPSALAERVVLGLMWMTNHQTAFSSPTVRFALRTLVSDYIYPGRFSTSYRPSSELLASVEEQIRRVAHTRLISDRWYDRTLNRHVAIDASIIDYVMVFEKGGRCGPRVLEMRWGQKFFESVKAHYTKPIDLSTYQRIEVPLDRRLFRWLDRQLAKKTSQVVQSCQTFARYKLAMSGAVIQKGGRTASSYIVGNLRESIDRLTSIGFRVGLTVDAAPPDYALTFERLAEGESSSVRVDDPVHLLIPMFDELAHGIPRTAPRRPVDARDRKVAERWMRAYGSTQAEWMIRRCLEIQRTTGGRRILKFAGLELYEGAAAGDYQRTAREQGGQASIAFRESMPARWKKYRDVIAAQPLPEGELEALRKVAADRVDAHRVAMTPETRSRIFEGELRDLKLNHHGVMSEREFFAFSTEESLSAALIARHGLNPFTMTDPS